MESVGDPHGSGNDVKHGCSENICFTRARPNIPQACNCQMGVVGNNLGNNIGNNIGNSIGNNIGNNSLQLVFHAKI